MSSESQAEGSEDQKHLTMATTTMTKPVNREPRTANTQTLRDRFSVRTVTLVLLASVVLFTLQLFWSPSESATGPTEGVDVPHHLLSICFRGLAVTHTASRIN